MGIKILRDGAEAVAFTVRVSRKEAARIAAGLIARFGDVRIMTIDRDGGMCDLVVLV